ncbi:MAG: hypothetical protein P8M25_03870 [Paracoccaceae bacterium]|nr:hypothetical protein [Paracoccaceae bacterium]
MAEKETTTITINGTEYTEDQLTDAQKAIINHIGDLERKINAKKFSLEQLQVGKEAFLNMLTKSLEEPSQLN